MTLFKDVFVVSGCGVGGGSLGYANTLYRPTRRARPSTATRSGRELEDWEAALAPHYETAEKMLGVTTYEGEGPADTLLRELADEMGVPRDLLDHPRRRLLRRARRDRRRPLLRRRGPAARRLHPLRRLHGRLPPQRQEHAAEELPLLRRARRRRDPARAHRRRGPPARRARRLRRLRGHQRALRRVVPQGPPARSPPRASSSPPARSAPTSCSSAAASAARCRASPSRIGHLVRTNSEAISAVTTKDDRHDFTKSIAITSSFYPDPDTHIENVTYGPGRRLDRAAVHDPRPPRARKLARPLWPRRWSRRTVIILTMQTLDNSMRLIPKRNLFGLGPRLQTQEDPGQAEPALHRGRRHRSPAARPRSSTRRRRPASPSSCSTSRRPRTSWAAR